MENNVVKQIIRSSLTIPSLDLDFAGTKELDSRITYTRSPYSTVIGPTGNIEYAPENILLRSEQFNTTWTTSGAYVTANTTLNPNGVLTAYKLSEDTSGGFHELYQTVSSPKQLICFSVYAKAGEYKKIELAIDDLSTGKYQVVFILENEGSVDVNNNQGAWGSLSCKITLVSNGWYRCEISGERVSGTSQKCSIYLWSDRPELENDYYGGDGTSGVYIWGAQLERNPTARVYSQTTSSEFYGPRFTHDPVTGVSLGLMSEPARTNLILNSNSPSNQNITVIGTYYHLSFTGTGTVTLSGASTSGPLIGTGTGEANRVVLRLFPSAGTLSLAFSGTVTNAQLEAGGNASSYIPTSGTAVTRSADSIQITGTNFSSWYNQIEGTIVLSASSRVSDISPSATVYSIDNNTTANNISLVYSFGGSRIEGRVNTNNSSEANLQYGISGQKFTSAFSYKMNQFDLSSAGGNNATDRAGNLTTLNRLRLGFDASGNDALSGSVARLRYYRQALPNKLSTLSI